MCWSREKKGMGIEKCPIYAEVRFCKVRFVDPMLFNVSSVRSTSEEMAGLPRAKTSVHVVAVGL